MMPLVGVDDRDWMRVRSIYGWIRPEYAHAATKKDLPLYGTATRRQASRAVGYSRNRRRNLALPLTIVAFAIGLAVLPAWHRFDAKLWNPGPKPPRVVHTRARVWVPAAKYGHVKVVPVRVILPGN